MIGTKPMETPARIEPAGIEEMIPDALTDLVLELQAEARDLGRGLHPAAGAELRFMTRIMNAYYSNLIEGHSTRPRDIAAALAGRTDELENRPLAEEAAAHVRVQDWIDALPADGPFPKPVSQEFIRELHRRFYLEMPEELRFVEHEGKSLEVTPGAYRRAGEEVAVGRHLPPSAARLPDFMRYFEMRYTGLTAGRTGKILSIPAAHHRLNYIHPFLDGNGRVSRLMSHAMFRDAGLGGQGLWSISRGLARGLQGRDEYKAQMDAADTPRQGDRDGRGNLSMNRLTSFTAWFLTVALDQVRFSSHMFDLEGLERRYVSLVRDLHPGYDRLPKLVSHLLRFPELRRGEAEHVLDVRERAARLDVARAEAAGFVISDTPRGPLRISFPLEFRERLFPNLFADEDLSAPAPPSPPRFG